MKPISLIIPLFLTFLTFLTTTLLPAQDLTNTRQVIIQSKEELKKAYILTSQPNNPPKNTKLYYSSYSKETLLKTQGGYTGHLLHGSYEELYPNHSLKVQGEHRYGLPHGQWVSWNKSGHLQSLTNWRNGYKHGTFKTFNDKGQLLQQGKYKRGKLHGALTTYKNGQKEKTIRYRKDKERIPRKKRTKKDDGEKQEVPTKGQ